MKKQNATRQHLESLSTSDLIDMADDYGIDIPDNLNRNFIIGEILEAAEYYSEYEEESFSIKNDEEDSTTNELPHTYNNTCIDLIMRNPAWVFVFWDIKESDLQKFSSSPDFEKLFLHVGFYEWKDDEKPEYTFDINIDNETREQYIMIPSDKKNMKIDFVAQYRKAIPDILASTRMVEIPSTSQKINKLQPGMKTDFSPLIQMSGMKKILHDHFLNHRQSFND